MLPSVIGSPGGCFGAIPSTAAAQALSVGREPTQRALTVGRLRQPGPACGRSGRWHAIAARGEIAIRATADPVGDRQRCSGGDRRGDDQDRGCDADADHDARRCGGRFLMATVLLIIPALLFFVAFTTAIGFIATIPRVISAAGRIFPCSSQTRFSGKICVCVFGSKSLILLVGAAGFEPATLCSQSRCATGLRYAPTGRKRGLWIHASGRASKQAPSPVDAMQHCRSWSRKRALPKAYLPEKIGYETRSPG